MVEVIMDEMQNKIFKGVEVKMKRYKVKSLSKEKLHKSEGRVRTEDIFIRDIGMAKMFLEYMQDNIKYLKRYEEDTAMYDHIQNELETICKTLLWVEECFKKHQEEGLL